MHVEKILIKKLDYGFEVLEKGTKIIITEAQAKQMAKDGYIADDKKNTNKIKKIKENGNK